MSEKKEPPPGHLSAEAKAAWNEIVRGGETRPQLVLLEGVAVQLARAREAQRRVDDEGLIVAGDKGAVAAHPALAIERAAQEQLRKWAEATRGR